MNALKDAFEERLQEIRTYLDLLDGIEKQIQNGAPRIGEDLTVSTQQQRILYSSVYLQLYNLVEATITRCVGALTSAISNDKRWFPEDLSIDFQREWVRFTARTHVNQLPEKRLEHAVKLLEHLTSRRAVSALTITKGDSGNWDDGAISKLAKRLGLPLHIPVEVEAPIKRYYKNDQGPLTYIKTARNNLAHGILSFAECGEGVTVAELRLLTDKVSGYLAEVVASFEESIAKHEFLLPEKRPRMGGA